MRLDELLSVHDFEIEARKRLPSAVFTYVRGGTEEEQTLRHNRSVFEHVVFRPRGLAGVATRSQKTMLWGELVDSPFGIAPMGATAICRRHCDLDLARAAHAARIPFVLSGLSTVPLEHVLAQAPSTWYQGYLAGDLERIGKLIARLQAAHVGVLVVTIDTAIGANREHNQRSGFSIPFRLSAGLASQGVMRPRWTVGVFANTLLRDGIPQFCNVAAEGGFRITEEPRGGFREGRDRLTWEHVRWIRDRWKGRLLVKGVLHPADAELAVRTGLDGLVVSNHGGRQLDGAVAALEALPDIVANVPRDFPVMADSGFRRGTDVLKAIALGARLVFLGRPMLYGASVAGEAGVTRVIEIMKTEIDRDLALLGCPDVADLDAGWLQKRGMACPTLN